MEADVKTALMRIEFVFLGSIVLYAYYEMIRGGLAWLTSQL